MASSGANSVSGVDGGRVLVWRNTSLPAELISYLQAVHVDIQYEPYTDDQYVGARALLIEPKASSSADIRKEIGEAARIALEAGLDLIVLTDSHIVQHASRAARSLQTESQSIYDSHQGPIREAQDALDAGKIEVVQRTEAKAIAGRIAFGSPRGRQRKGLNIEGTYTPAHRAMLEIAFADAQTLRITPLDGGRVARGVYRVLATNSDGLSPMPFAVKIDSRVNILKELGNHLLHARDYVPFMHRPNVVLHRSFVGNDTGILVTNYVLGSHSLARAVERDGATHAIHSLFSTATSGWWSQAFSRNGANNQLLAGLEDWFDPKVSHRKQTLESAASIASDSFGTPPAVNSLIANALRSMPPTEHWRGRVHGDLNRGNVCVQGDLPHLIDFSAMSEATLLADPATLEVSLVIELGLDLATSVWWAPIGWLTLADELYGANALTKPVRMHPPTVIADSVYEKYWHAVRMIRLHAAAIEAHAGEYAIVVGAALVRVASFLGNTDRERLLGAWALDHAWRLVKMGNP